MTTHGCDLSHHNPLPNLSGYDFVIHKVTEGSTYVDSEWHARRAALVGPRRLRGGYHFFAAGVDPYAQIENFRRNAHISAGDIVAFDYEWQRNVWSNHKWSTLVTDAHMCLLMLNSLYPNNRVIMYTNPYTLKGWVQPGRITARDGLWIATLGTVPTVPYVIWQYTETPYDLDKGNFDTFEDMTRWAYLSDRQAGHVQQLLNEE